MKPPSSTSLFAMKDTCVSPSEAQQRLIHAEDHHPRGGPGDLEALHRTVQDILNMTEEGYHHQEVCDARVLYPDHQVQQSMLAAASHSKRGLTQDSPPASLAGIAGVKKKRPSIIKQGKNFLRRRGSKAKLESRHGNTMTGLGHGDHSLQSPMASHGSNITEPTGLLSVKSNEESDSESSGSYGSYDYSQSTGLSSRLTEDGGIFGSLLKTSKKALGTIAKSLDQLFEETEGEEDTETEDDDTNTFGSRSEFASTQSPYRRTTRRNEPTCPIDTNDSHRFTSTETAQTNNQTRSILKISSTIRKRRNSLPRSFSPGLNEGKEMRDLRLERVKSEEEIAADAMVQAVESWFGTHPRQTKETKVKFESDIKDDSPTRPVKSLAREMIPAIEVTANARPSREKEEWTPKLVAKCGPKSPPKPDPATLAKTVTKADTKPVSTPSSTQPLKPVDPTGTVDPNLADHHSPPTPEEGASASQPVQTKSSPVQKDAKRDGEEPAHKNSADFKQEETTTNGEKVDRTSTKKDKVSTPERIKLALTRSTFMRGRQLTRVGDVCRARRNTSQDRSSKKDKNVKEDKLLARDESSANKEAPRTPEGNKTKISPSSEKGMLAVSISHETAVPPPTVKPPSTVRREAGTRCPLDQLSTSDNIFGAKETKDGCSSDPNSSEQVVPAGPEDAGRNDTSAPSVSFSKEPRKNPFITTLGESDNAKTPNSTVSKNVDKSPATEESGKPTKNCLSAGIRRKGQNHINNPWYYEEEEEPLKTKIILTSNESSLNPTRVDDTNNDGSQNSFDGNFNDDESSTIMDDSLSSSDQSDARAITPLCGEEEAANFLCTDQCNYRLEDPGQPHRICNLTFFPQLQSESSGDPFVAGIQDHIEAFVAGLTGTAPVDDSLPPGEIDLCGQVALAKVEKTMQPVSVQNVHALFDAYKEELELQIRNTFSLDFLDGAMVQASKDLSAVAEAVTQAESRLPESEAKTPEGRDSPSGSNDRNSQSRSNPESMKLQVSSQAVAAVPTMLRPRSPSPGTDKPTARQKPPTREKTTKEKKEKTPRATPSTKTNKQEKALPSAHKPQKEQTRFAFQKSKTPSPKKNSPSKNAFGVPVYNVSVFAVQEEKFDLEEKEETSDWVAFDGKIFFTPSPSRPVQDVSRKKVDDGEEKISTPKQPRRRRAVLTDMVFPVEIVPVGVKALPQSRSSKHRTFAV